MKAKVIAVEDSLPEVKQALEKQGFKTVDMNDAAGQSIQAVDAVVMNNQESNAGQTQNTNQIEDLISSVWS